MTSGRGRSVLCALAALLLGSGARAQQPDGTRAALAAALREAQSANRMVRFHSDAGELRTGRVTWLSDSAVGVGPARVPLAAQQALEARIARPDPLWDGTLMGGVASAVLLGPLSIDLGESLGERPYSRREKAQAFIGAAVLGAMIGFLVDAAREPPGEWRLVWKKAGAAR